MITTSPHLLRVGALLVFAAAVLPAQSTPAPAPSEAPAPVYLIAPNDVIVIRAMNAEELSDKPFRVDPEGFVNLPLVGRIKAAALTVEQFEAALTDQLKPIIQEPQVAVSIIERAKTVDIQRSVAVLGAFKSAGFYPLTGQDRVLDVISRAGGLLPNASRRVRLVRRADQGPIPLPNAAPDPGGKGSTVEISLTPAMEPVNSAENIDLKPFDTLTASRLEMVYVTGEFGKTGAFPLEDRESYSVTQLVSLAGGVTPGGNAKKARIMRPVLNTSRRAEIPVDINAILSGQATDMPLLPNDVLVVPRSGGSKTAVGRVVLYAMPAVITSLIYLALR